MTFVAFGVLGLLLVLEAWCIGSEGRMSYECSGPYCTPPKAEGT